ncbi:MAG: hypothetical protein HY903_17695 [Deltaproteobacteria bacterium]|nr:hypothetical protein [Deltaproteobacteria bacterium]
MTRRLVVVALGLCGSIVGCKSNDAATGGMTDVEGPPGGDPETVECYGAGLNACGNCSSACATENHGSAPGATPFLPPAAGSGLVQNPDGSLTLGTSGAATTEFAWPSNDGEGTISRVDTLLNREVGRYATVLRIVGANPADPTHVPDVDEWSSNLNHPSRTTVDGDGNAYVANRAHKGGRGHGSVTKIAFYDQDLCDLSLALCQCVDRNQDGEIQTSLDCEGFGINDQGLCPDEAVALGHPPQPNGIELANPREFKGYGDECLLWTVPLPIPSGAAEAWARAMALDPDGFIWVGDYFNRRFYKLNPFDGALLPGDPSRPETATTGIAVRGQPYGAVVDSQGFLWYGNDYDDQPGKLQRIDTRTGAVTPENDYFLKTGPGGYGITVDAKDRIWLASHGEGAGTTGGTVVRYDPATDTTSVFFAGLGGSWNGRGITATPEGVIWAAFHAGGAKIVGFDHDSGAVLDRVDLAARCGASTSIGVGIGAGGAVLAVNQDSDNVCKYDPNGGGTVVSIPIGQSPYTYSDFTGNIFRTFTARKGTYKEVYACDLGWVSWARVEWSGETPGASSIEVRVKNSATAAGLGGAPALGPATQPPATTFDLLPLNLDAAFLQVEFLLLSDAAGNAPTLRGYEVARMCTSPPL